MLLVILFVLESYYPIKVDRKFHCFAMVQQWWTDDHSNTVGINILFLICIVRLLFFLFCLFKDSTSIYGNNGCLFPAPINSYRWGLHCLWFQPSRKNLSSKAGMGLAWRNIHGKKKVYFNLLILLLFFLYLFILSQGLVSAV